MLRNRFISWWQISFLRSNSFFTCWYRNAASLRTLTIIIIKICKTFYSQALAAEKSIRIESNKNPLGKWVLDTDLHQSDYTNRKNQPWLIFLNENLSFQRYFFFFHNFNKQIKNKKQEYSASISDVPQSWIDSALSKAAYHSVITKIIPAHSEWFHFVMDFSLHVLACNHSSKQRFWTLT